MRKTVFLSAAAAAMMLAQHSFAGEIIIGGRFEPSYTVGYEYGTWPADTSGAQAGTLIDFSNSAIYAGPKSITFDTPVYGELTETFTTLATLYFTQAGEFYQLVGPTGWMDVNIINPGWGISSFSFTDVAYAPPPVDPPPVDPPPVDPPSCAIACGPPIDPSANVPAAPEASTWLMMLLGFAALGYAALRRSRAAAI
jgi:hypothetical protein